MSSAVVPIWVWWLDEVHHHEDGVAGAGIGLGEAEQVRVVDGVEAQRAQLLQRRVRPPDLVEPADVGHEAAPRRLGAGPVARAELVLLAVEVLLAARADGDVLEQLEARVDAPGGAHHRGEHRADLEHRRAAELQRLVQDVRGVHEEVRPHVVRVRGQLAAVVLELAALGAPREVRVGLGEARSVASWCIIAGRVNASARNSTSGSVFLTSQISQCQKFSGLVCGLSTRKIRTPGVDPDPHHPEALGVEALGVVVEVDRVDVLVLLRRVLRVGDRAVGLGGEPLRVRLDPGVVRGRLEREVERDLHAELPGALDEGAEVLHRAQLRVDGVVPALGAADRPR